MERKSRAQADIAGIGSPSAGTLRGPLCFAARELCTECRAFLEPGPVRMQVERVFRHGLATGARPIGKQHNRLEATRRLCRIGRPEERGRRLPATGAGPMHAPPAAPTYDR